MLDTIIYIPTILAYMFVTLLVVILCFITIYVSHKIFLCIFDTLPVSRTSSLIESNIQPAGDNASLGQSMRMTNLKTYDTSVAALFQDHLPERKAKTALRIIVTLEPCYVAYVTFVYDTVRLSKSSNSNSRPSEVDMDEPTVVGKKLVKYYDRLSEIPLDKRMQVCTPTEERPNEDITLEDYHPMQQRNSADEELNSVDLLFKDMFRAPRTPVATRLVVTRRTNNSVILSRTSSKM